MVEINSSAFSISSALVYILMQPKYIWEGWGSASVGLFRQGGRGRGLMYTRRLLRIFYICLQYSLVQSKRISVQLMDPEENETLH